MALMIIPPAIDICIVPLLLRTVACDAGSSLRPKFRLLCEVDRRGSWFVT